MTRETVPGIEHTPTPFHDDRTDAERKSNRAKVEAEIDAWVREQLALGGRIVGGLWVYPSPLAPTNTSYPARRREELAAISAADVWTVEQILERAG